MSWGYWGIVTGLVLLVVMLFVCVDLVSSNAKGLRQTGGRAAGKPVEASKRASTTSWQAA